jgi:hypothetical protein
VSCCPNCESKLRIVQESEHGDLKLYSEPKKGAIGVSYAITVDDKTYSCQSKREQLHASRLLREEPALFKHRLKWQVDNPEKFRRAEWIARTIRAVETDVAKRIPAQGDLEEDKPRAITRF